jgi:hypothetical protein
MEIGAQNNKTQEKIPIPIQRGRPRKRGNRNRPTKSTKLRVPKFIQLAEAVKEGCAKQGRRRKGVISSSIQNSHDSSNAGDSLASDENGDVVKVLASDEACDRLKKADWERRNGYQ